MQLNINYNKIKTKEQLEEFLKSKFTFNIIGQQLENGRTIKEYNDKQIITTCNKIFAINNSRKIFGTNPLTGEEEWMRVSNIIHKGFYINPNIYRKLYYKTDEYKDKVKQSCIEKYGSYEKYLKEVDKSRRKTIKERYGVNSFLERGKHYDKVENAMIEKYGVKHAIQNEESMKRMKETTLQRYGVEFFLERGEHYKVIEDSMMEKYGVKNNFEIISNSTGKVSKLERGIISTLIYELKLNYKKVKCYKTTQFRISFEDTWYNVDFYDPINNIVIEVFGDLWHCNPAKYKEDYINKGYNLTAKEIWEKDEIRKNRIIEKLGCKFIVIWESDWEKNKKGIITYLKEIYDKNNKEKL